MMNLKLNSRRGVSNLAQGTAIIGLSTALIALSAAVVTDHPERALGHSLTAAAYLLIGLLLLLRPGGAVLSLALFFVVVISATAAVGAIHYELDVLKLRLLGLFVALVAAGISEGQARLQA